ncbi:MAG: aminodeoxychorismate synthase component I [Candidatus Omnitrophica bacterium]|nr:aminodeoxychorismate synthase component I [Candidatus Omnitrophota bacterium]
MIFEKTTKQNLKKIINKPGVFLETAALDKENKDSFLFSEFIDVLVFNYGDNVDEFFEKGDQYLKKGYWLSGYFAYEFGYFLDSAQASLRKKNKTPLAWLGVSEAPEKIHSCKDKARNLNYQIRNLKPNINGKEYAKAINKIKHYLREGQTYQVNHTFKVKFDFSGSVVDFYIALRRTQPTAYSAFLNTGEHQILSFSPELFFRKNTHLTSRPMKGTVKRGLTFDEDSANREWLKSNQKTRAENIMIVDLLRNDLGRIAKKVWTPRLFDVEKHSTLYQMTSTIKAVPRRKIKTKELFCSLFPCGSVTGAPKVKTMQIISKLEKEPRGIYTGAIGYISPHQRSCFNVAIRTICLNKKKGEIGVGGGIVYDSSTEEEYKEALLKADFLTRKTPRIKLIETILWDKKYFLLNLHIKRLILSAQYFSINMDKKKIILRLRQAAKKLKTKHKVRLTVDEEGKINIEIKKSKNIPKKIKICLSNCRMDKSNPYLYHKTTHRSLYDEERKKAAKNGFFEVIFLNQQGQVTEGAISNIFILKKNKLFTPPVESGLLGGVFRQYLLSKGKATEKVLYQKDLQKADKIFITNSICGLREAALYKNLDKDSNL